ncbi:glycosyltransferase family 2 protein [Wenyingzhuangia sp. 1_MG-2023]|nr:glycosyltransferase family 2 protein [Wenyingzhuangia sp. 1_MG-2023]
MKINPVVFSVVITVYNKEKYIYESLKSTCAQLLKPAEIIVVNDGSTDDSLQEITKVNDARIRVFTIENKGVSNARNFGAKQTKGTHIAFLDGDDLWLENHLEEIHKMICLFPEESIYALGTSYEKEEKLIEHVYAVSNNQAKRVDYFNASLHHSILHPSSFVVVAELYSQLGGFDIRYTNYEDVEFWFRLGLKYPIVFSSKKTVLLRAAENSLSKNKVCLNSYCFFEDYDHVQTNNKAFYRILDLNRYSLALICKENKEREKFKILYAKIDGKHLSFRKKIFLKLPSFVITGLKKIKERL